MIVAAVAVGVLLGGLIERLLLQRIYSKDPVLQLLVSIRLLWDRLKVDDEVLGHGCRDEDGRLRQAPKRRGSLCDVHRPGRIKRMGSRIIRSATFSFAVLYMIRLCKPSIEVDFCEIAEIWRIH